MKYFRKKNIKNFIGHIIQLGDNDNCKNHHIGQNILLQDKFSSEYKSWKGLMKYYFSGWINFQSLPGPDTDPDPSSAE